MADTQKILVIEDDTDINNLISAILKKAGYQVTQSFSGTEAVLRLGMERFDLLILDLLLPGMSGEELLQKIRKEDKIETPTIVLSAKSSLEDKVQLLTLGADDYMTKPFEPEELLARCFACLRRKGTGAQPAANECISYKRMRVFPDARRVTVNEKQIELTPHEYAILCILVQSPDKVFSRETLYEQVWNGGYYGEDNTVNVHVSNIRKKLASGDPENEYIKTVWGIGFKMA